MHNSTAKPITGYHFQRFKELHQMRGIELEKDNWDKKFAEKMRKKREQASHDKNMYDAQMQRK